MRAVAIEEILGYYGAIAVRVCGNMSIKRCDCLERRRHGAKGWL
jgi:hypothetical protein